MGGDGGVDGRRCGGDGAMDGRRCGGDGGWWYGGWKREQGAASTFGLCSGSLSVRLIFLCRLFSYVRGGASRAAPPCLAFYSSSTTT
ncbi:hypothetical protein QMP26_19215 [Enterocloster clostridioformis]|uniref:hypothetical protein n=1 Tax=Enterocloster clostridioformis TaxID=1531 RepID=UPI00267637AD|nr:hypothetical protein [Enterocloster clostridioformis]